MDTNDYLDCVAELVRNEGGTGTDYAVSKYLGIRSSSVYNYRKKRSKFDDRTCVLVAHALGVPELQVIADIHAERAEDQELRSFWKKVARNATKGAAAALLAMVVIPYSVMSLGGTHAANIAGPNQPSQTVTNTHIIHYVYSANPATPGFLTLISISVFFLLVALYVTK